MQTCSPSGGPSLEEPFNSAPRVDTAAHSRFLAISPEKGPPLPGERDDLATPTKVVGPPCLAPRQEPTGLPVRVLSTISEARAPSARCLYALKWSALSDWCAVQNEDSASCDISLVLSFQGAHPFHTQSLHGGHSSKPRSCGRPVYGQE